MNVLSSLKINQTAVIESLKGGRLFISRILAMGFTPGTPVTMLQNKGRGPVLVFLRDTQVALGRGEASRIEMEGDRS